MKNGKNYERKELELKKNTHTHTYIVLILWEKLISQKEKKAMNHNYNKKMLRDEENFSSNQ